MLVDTHCHLILEGFQDDLDAVLDRAREMEVRRIVIPGIDLPTSRAAVELAESRPGLYAAVGVHPHHAETWRAGAAAELRQLSRSPAVVAIGEIGLDYYRQLAPRGAQLQALRAQLDLAADLDLPVILHNRDSLDDLLEELEARAAGLPQSLEKGPGVLHAFSGDEEAAHRATQLGYYLGLGGPLTYPNADSQRQVAGRAPLSCLLIETDAPYLAPQPRRGKRNEPAFVRFVGEALADLREISFNEMAQHTTSNASQLFGWNHGTSNGDIL